MVCDEQDASFSSFHLVNLVKAQNDLSHVSMSQPISVLGGGFWALAIKGHVGPFPTADVSGGGHGDL